MRTIELIIKNALVPKLCSGLVLSKTTKGVFFFFFRSCCVNFFLKTIAVPPPPRLIIQIKKKSELALCGVHAHASARTYVR